MFLEYLLGPVGNGQKNNEDDVAKVQKRLGSLGYLPEKQEYEPTGIIDLATSLAIKNFQKDNDLKQDGYLNAKGETLSALNKEEQENEKEEKKDIPKPSEQTEEDKKSEESDESEGGDGDEEQSDEGDNRCNELQNELQSLQVAVEEDSKAKSEAVENHNTFLEEWRSASEELRNIKAEVRQELMLGSMTRIGAIGSLANLILVDPRVIEAKENLQNAKNAFEANEVAQKLYQKDIERNLKEIDKIKPKIEQYC